LDSSTLAATTLAAKTRQQPMHVQHAPLRPVAQFGFSQIDPSAVSAANFP
jgi:hypothetical protein